MKSMASWLRCRFRAPIVARRVVELDGRNLSPAPSESAGSAGFQPARGRSPRMAAWRLQGDFAPRAGWKPALPARSRSFSFAEIWPNAIVTSLLPPLFLSIRARATGCARAGRPQSTAELVPSGSREKSSLPKAVPCALNCAEGRVANTNNSRLTQHSMRVPQVRGIPMAEVNCVGYRTSVHIINRENETKWIPRCRSSFGS